MRKGWKDIFFGPAKDPLNPRIFHTLTLAAFFAWVGLGADLLSSSCYGPEEAFRALGPHKILVLPLAAFVILTVSVLSASYAQLIEAFPSGGGGYLVSSKVLGKYPGLFCGWGLVLDYILTIAVSVSSGIDALFSFLPPVCSDYKIYATTAVLVILILVNLRGVKESILLLFPIFVAFIVTHALAIIVALVVHSTEVPGIFASAPEEIRSSAAVAGGMLPLLAIFFGAYSLGAGTFTGIEAVSNSMQILREPRVATGKKTMLYMAVSLSFVASGILIGYLLVDVKHEAGKTLNAILLGDLFGSFRPWGIPAGDFVAMLALLSEGALLFVAAQAGFIGGPRTLATMALDRWVPARFSHFSNRLVIQDGVLFMGGAAIALVVFTGANIRLLIVLYSTIVFLTFTLSQLGMCIHWIKTRPAGVRWRRKLGFNTLGLTVTLCVLAMMITFNLRLGGWVSLVLASVGAVTSLLIRRHYERVRRSIQELDLLIQVPPVPIAGPEPQRAPHGPTAVLLVSGFNGLGMHSFFTVFRVFPRYFNNFVFISVGVVDYEEFKGVEEMGNLRRRTDEALERYVAWARAMNLYAESRHAIGTDLVKEIEDLAKTVVEEFPGAIFFGGQLVFENENAFTRSLHSQAAFEIQRRLQFSGLPMVLLPVRIRGFPKPSGSGPAASPPPPQLTSSTAPPH
jgi:amino acid transporter